MQVQGAVAASRTPTKISPSFPNSLAYIIARIPRPSTSLKASYTKPEDGEEAGGPEHCLQRLDAWAFAEGGVFVWWKSSKANNPPSWEFNCIFYGEETCNTRKLEDRKMDRLSVNVSGTLSIKCRCSITCHTVPRLPRGKGDKCYLSA